MKWYRLWLENEHKNKFPVFKAIEESVMKKWLKSMCWFNGETYWFNEKEFGLVYAPYNEMGYIVKFELI